MSQDQSQSPRTGLQLQWGKAFLSTQCSVYSGCSRDSAWDASKVQLSSGKKKNAEVDGCKGGQTSLEVEGQVPFSQSTFRISLTSSGPSKAALSRSWQAAFWSKAENSTIAPKAHVSPCADFIIYQVIAKDCIVQSSFIETATTGLSQWEVKKQRNTTEPIHQWPARDGWADGCAQTEHSLSTSSKFGLELRNWVSSLTAALVYLLVLSTRVNEVHLIQGQGPVCLRNRPNNQKISYSKNIITW